MQDLAGAVTFLVATVGAPIAAIWALVQWRDSLRQRKLEHRWRQAEVGRQLVTQLFDEDGEAGAALEIIDGERDQVETAEGTVVNVSRADIERALAVTSDGDAVSRRIRRIFDALFYRLERFQHMIEIGLVEREDVQHPTQYYCRKIGPLTPTVRRYLGLIGYSRALALITALQNEETQARAELPAGAADVSRAGAAQSPTDS